MADHMIDSRVVKHRSRKLWLWLFWLMVMVISVVYTIMSFIAFRKIRNVQKHDNNGVSDDILWSVLAATFFGPFAVIAFFVFGTATLARKTVTESGITYSFGALHFSTLWLAAVVLMSAVSLNGQKDVMQNVWQPKGPGIANDLPWNSGETALVQATYVFAYILSIAYFVLFFIMFFFRTAVRQVLLDDDGSGPPPPLESPTDAPAKKTDSAPASESLPVTRPDAAVNVATTGGKETQMQSKPGDSSSTGTLAGKSIAGVVHNSADAATEGTKSGAETVRARAVLAADKPKQHVQAVPGKVVSKPAETPALGSVGDKTSESAPKSYFHSLWGGKGNETATKGTSPAAEV